MLDAKDKSLEDTELHDLAEEAPDNSAEEAKRQKRLLKCEKLCRRSIRRVGRTNAFWYCFGLFSVLGALVAHYFKCSQQWRQMYKFSTFTFDSWGALAIGLIFLFLAISRISGNSKSLRALRDRKKYLRGELPKESDTIIRELYFFYCKRRCVHYWLTVGFGALFMLCILYPLLASGIDCLANWGEFTPKHVKLFEKTTLMDPKQWKPEHKFVVLGLVGGFFNLCQYFFFRSEYTKFVDAFEDRFGGEKIVDECLYCSRMWKVDFRYKSFAFIIVCFCGCFFYLLFKRLICVIFDKSFAY